jgi:hypothetical protein
MDGIQRFQGWNGAGYVQEGAEFIVVICGDIMTMSGLPRKLAAGSIYLNDASEIEGLFQSLKSNIRLFKFWHELCKSTVLVVVWFWGYNVGFF